MRDQPLQILLKLSKLCNLRCKYCYEMENLANRESISAENLQKLFASIGEFLLSDSGDRYYPTFVFHGGEPLLNSPEYFRVVILAQAKYLSARGIDYANALQTNLYKINTNTLDYLVSEGFSIGVSFDVLGSSRVNIIGRNSIGEVEKNIFSLLERDIDFGGVSVITKDNVHQSPEIYEYYNDIGKSCQLIPAFWQPYMTAAQANLVPAHNDVIAAFLNVSNRQLRSVGNSIAYPIYDYQMAAIRKIRNEPSWNFDPRMFEWCLVVDTNGEVYSYGDAYTENGKIGNAFIDQFATLMSKQRRSRSIQNRLNRLSACKNCDHNNSCNRVPALESHQSDRDVNYQQGSQCGIAKEMISKYVELFKLNPGAMNTLLQQRLARRVSEIEWA